MRPLRPSAQLLCCASLVLTALCGCKSASPTRSPSCCQGTGAVCCPPTKDDTAGVLAASEAFYSALNQMFVGNIAPMEAVWSHEADVSQLGPMGGRIVGWDAVQKEWRHEASLNLGGKVVAKDVQVVAGPCMGYTVTEEVGKNMTADGKPIEIHFRATNIFRLERDGWKMVHHHTDESLGLIEATTKAP